MCSSSHAECIQLLSLRLIALIFCFIAIGALHKLHPDVIVKLGSCQGCLTLAIKYTALTITAAQGQA